MCQGWLLDEEARGYCDFVTLATMLDKWKSCSSTLTYYLVTPTEYVSSYIGVPTYSQAHGLVSVESKMADKIADMTFHVPPIPIALLSQLRLG